MRRRDFGKPRPALIVQADQFEDTATVRVLLANLYVIH